MGNMKKCNYIISGISAILGIIIMFLSQKLSIDFTKHGPGAGFWPFILGIIMTAVSVILFIATVINKKKLEEIPVVLNSHGNKKVYIMMGVITGFCVLLPVIGFYLSMLLFLPLNMLVLGMKSKKKIAIFTVIILVMVYVVFEMLLKTVMPKPFFME